MFDHEINSLLTFLQSEVLVGLLKILIRLQNQNLKNYDYFVKT